MYLRDLKYVFGNFVLLFYILIKEIRNHKFSKDIVSGLINEKIEL
jgi:hypothetical protein